MIFIFVLWVDYSLKKFTGIDEFKALHEKLLEFIIINKRDKLLAYITGQKAIEPGSREWIASLKD